MAKKVDLLKAKERKQKTIAVAGAVLLIGLLAFQLPRTLKTIHNLNKKPAPVAASTTAAPPSGTPSLAAPSLAGSEQTTTSPGTGELANTDVAPPAEQGQLAAFTRFESKDPFVQQLSNERPFGGTSSSGSSGGSSSSSGSTSGSSSGGGSQPGPGSAVISVNGTLMSVAVGTDFPQSATDPSVQPLFHLVSATAHTVKIAIVGGSYSSGAATVTLRENKPVTLMNTADGTRYTIVLKPQGTPVPGSGGTTTTPTTTLPSSTP